MPARSLPPGSPRRPRPARPERAVTADAGSNLVAYDGDTARRRSPAAGLAGVRFVGLKGANTVRRSGPARTGATAILVGESLMRAPDPGIALRVLTGGEGEAAPR